MWGVGRHEYLDRRKLSTEGALEYPLLSSDDPVIDKILGFDVPMSAIESQLVLRRQYLHNYLVADMDNTIEAWPMLTYRPQMATDLVDPLYESIERFIANRVSHYTNLSLTEFLELPVNVSQEVMRLCERMAKETNQVAQSSLDEIENSIGKK